MEFIGSAMCVMGATSDMIYAQIFAGIIVLELLAQRAPKAFVLVKRVSL